MKNFAITGVAGYIAPRHLKAIKDTSNQLIAALDPNDSVGILDRFFPNTAFFTEFERFDRHIEKIKRQNKQDSVDYISICSPNHLHDAHIRFGLRIGANVICEKPLVLNPWNLDAIEELESESKGKVNSVLQLRLHPQLINLKNSLDKTPASKKFYVDLTYITSRGVWYNYSWKGMNEKSGGVATNIGIHFFDLLIWLFGNVQSSTVHLSSHNKAGGFIELENAYVRWFLSIDKNDLPLELQLSDKNIFRSIKINGQDIEFSEGFTELHTKTYEEILAGRGFGIEHVRPSIELAHRILQHKLSENYECAHNKVIEIFNSQKSKNFASTK